MIKTLLSNLISFILPITVLVFIPLSIEKNTSVKCISAFLPGFVIICFGLCIIFSTVFMFIKYGKGTLVPWSPTQNLVITGLYRYVRNPMIIGVLIVLTGESVAFLSMNIFIWAVTFFIINNVFLSYPRNQL